MKGTQPPFGKQDPSEKGQEPRQYNYKIVAHTNLSIEEIQQELDRKWNLKSNILIFLTLLFSGRKDIRKMRQEEI